jgi:hypothetical protein
MRGFDQKMVAILIDGIPVLDPYYGGNNTDISQFLWRMYPESCKIAVSRRHSTGRSAV